MTQDSYFRMPTSVHCGHCHEKLLRRKYAGAPDAQVPPERIHRFHDPSKPSWSVQCTRCGHYTCSERYARGEELRAADPVELRRVTAFHEARHAVFGLRQKQNPVRLLEVTIASDTIEPDATNYGRCRWGGMRPGLQQIELLLAGLEGAIFDRGSEPFNSASLWRDEEQKVIENIAMNMLGRNDVAAAYEQFTLPAEERVRQAFLSPALQRELVAVAHALLEHETLSGDEVSAIVASV